MNSFHRQPIDDWVQLHIVPAAIGLHRRKRIRDTCIRAATVRRHAARRDINLAGGTCQD